MSRFATGLLATGSISGAFKAGLIGGLSGAAFSGIGAMEGLSKPSAIGLHGIAGGVKAELTGGKFSRGFMVSAFTKAVSLSNKLPGETALQRTVSAGLLAGAAMHLAGGDFRLGFIAGAMAQFLNAEGGGEEDIDGKDDKPAWPTDYRKVTSGFSRNRVDPVTGNSS